MKNKLETERRQLKELILEDLSADGTIFSLNTFRLFLLKLRESQKSSRYYLLKEFDRWFKAEFGEFFEITPIIDDGQRLELGSISYEAPEPWDV